ncbi:MAG TPA: HAMP domain-containing sensor histidine kinase [Rhizomicrobium sp.]|jgi:signal transduction histidine kinase|nr:HAMP domain-containing sensor histidine kinase [Rhizomicrobium sp.]
MTIMAIGVRAQIGNAWKLVAHSLSGRLLLLTLLYVLLIQALIFVPSVARYYQSLLAARVESAEIAILPFTEVGKEQLSAKLRSQLLLRAGATAVMLRRSEQREIFLSDVIPTHIDRTVDLRTASLWSDMVNALDSVLNGGHRILRITSATRILGAQAVEVILDEAPLRANLMDYVWRALGLAVFISLVAAVLVFISLYLVLVRPMRRITTAMVSFREDPENPRRIVAPSSRHDEIGLAERELAVMQREIYTSLQQKTRLAALGTAVAKIQHDLRNILSSAQLASDRLSTIDDPVVQRLAPRLVTSIDHAVALATNTLRYGRADEHPPERTLAFLAPVLDEAVEAALDSAPADRPVTIEKHVDPALQIDADREQLFRIALNVLRNGVEAVSSHRADGVLIVSATRKGSRVIVTIADNGPGISQAMAPRLFQPFATGNRTGGSGLGLAIARDLARAHGGDLTLVRTGAGGTEFAIEIPDREDPLHDVES